MKILILTATTARWQGFSVLGYEAELLDAWILNSQLMTDPFPVREYDLFILADPDMRAVGSTEQMGPIAERVQTGGRLVVVADPVLLGVSGVPWTTGARAVGAPVGDVSVNEDVLFGKALKRFENTLRYTVDWALRDGMLARSKTGHGVADSRASGFLFIPQLGDRTPAVLKAVLESEPAWLPNAQAEPADNAPEWVSSLEWSTLTRARAAMQQADAAVAGAIGARNRALADLESEFDWSRLLWARGRLELEPLVQRALNELGVPVSAPATRDRQDLEYSTTEAFLVIEVGASRNEIGVDKGSQLYRWIGDIEAQLVETEDARPVLGVVVGNGYCDTAPQTRPAEIFSAPLREFSRRHGYRLLTTQRLFELITTAPVGRERTVRELLGLPTTL